MFDPADRNASFALVGGLAVAGAAVLQGAPGVTAIGPVRRVLFPRLAGRGAAGRVALTFDDGPDPATTPAFLELLAARRVSATFFLLGPMVRRAPQLAAEIVAAGHEIGVHGWEHRYLTVRGPRATYRDIAMAADEITAATGVSPRLYRPPYGVLNAGALLATRRLRLVPVLWDCWGKEWSRGSTPESVFSTLSSGLRDGSTVLLHDSDCTSPPGSADAALGALPLLLDECETRGLRPGPLGEHVGV
jgi:peptidoglycan/xylan/chitin deacetylase (PgdA/CDA1 family)